MTPSRRRSHGLATRAADSTATLSAPQTSAMSPSMAGFGAPTGRVGVHALPSPGLGDAWPAARGVASRPMITDPTPSSTQAGQPSGGKRSPWLWVSLALALVAVGLLVWGLSTKSDLDGTQSDLEKAN